MILADGIIDARELEALYKIGIEQYELTPEDITSVIRDAGSSLILPETLRGKVQFLYNLVTIALADEQIDEEESTLLKKYILRMGFDNSNVDGIADYLITSAKDKKTIDQVMSKIND